MRSKPFSLLFFVLVFGLVTPLPGNDADRPNIIFIMSDDHATTGIGAYGGRLSELNPTPNLDQLAREGVLLENCFCTNSICTPSRATLMTGQYSHRNGVYTLRGQIPEKQQTLTRLIMNCGYETAMIGKWHLSAEPSAFDYYCVLPGQGWYHNPEFRIRGPKKWPNNTRRVKKHSSDAITDIAINWLKGRKVKTRPFFLMHHFKAPHDDFENAERFDFLYDDVDIPEPESYTKTEKIMALKTGKPMEPACPSGTSEGTWGTTCLSTNR